MFLGGTLPLFLSQKFGSARDDVWTVLGNGDHRLALLIAVLGALGLELKAEPGPADWDQLAICGAPLMVREGAVAGEEYYTGTSSSVTPTAQKLLNSIRDACRELRDRQIGEPSERRREAVQALLLALRMHFPTFFREHLAGIELYEKPLSAPITGRTVRLTREAVAALARYL